MSFTLADVETEYNKDKNLKKEEVTTLLEWANNQPHLPKINEVQAILFLHSCYYQPEEAKTTIDKFFTSRTLWTDVFTNRNPLSTPLQTNINFNLITTLPQKSPEGYTILFIDLQKGRSENFHYTSLLKYLDMICMCNLYQEGTSEGHIILTDLKGFTFGHLVKIGLFATKKIINYMQEAIPLRLKGLHFINIVPFMDKFLALIKPFMKKELIDALVLHSTLESLTKFIPLECLPEDYGGAADSVAILHDKVKEKLSQNIEIFKWEETLTLDKSKKK